jgi:hypothetical protein
MMTVHVAVNGVATNTLEFMHTMTLKHIHTGTSGYARTAAVGGLHDRRTQNGRMFLHIAGIMPCQQVACLAARGPQLS